MKNLAPILLFTYKRLDTLKLTVSALQKNHLAKDSELFIFSDGPKSDKDLHLIKNIRDYIQTIDGFKVVKILESKINKGLANSVIEGVGNIFKVYEKVIVLEDDLITSFNFLTFMNLALNFYSSNESIFSIAGYSPPIPKPMNDVYFTKRASSWGWATWRDRWLGIDWEIDHYHQYKRDSCFRKKFNEMGSDMYKMFNDQMSGKINSWAIRWCFHQYLTQQYTVYPVLSKVENIGTGADATHTIDYYNRFKTFLDCTDNKEFTFTNNVKLENYYLKYFLKQFNIRTRIKYKILNYLKL